MSRTSRRPDAGDSPEDTGTSSTAPPADGGTADGQPPSAPTEIGLADERWAEHLRTAVPSLFLYASLQKPFPGVTPAAHKLFMDQLLADCGKPRDPVAVMLIEQLALAHYNMGLLHCRAAHAPGVEAAGAYSAAAARLMAEFRRTAIGLQAYRLASRQLASDPAKDLIIPAEEANPAGNPSGKDGADGELIATMEATDADESIIRYPRPEAV